MTALKKEAKEGSIIGMVVVVHCRRWLIFDCATEQRLHAIQHQQTAAALQEGKELRNEFIDGGWLRLPPVNAKGVQPAL
jgi:hypothetical protein